MIKRRLGHSTLAFAPIALGGSVFGWTIGEAMSHRLLDAFVDAGFSLVDTAEGYTWWVPGNKGGESETCQEEREDYRADRGVPQRGLERRPAD